MLLGVFVLSRGPGVSTFSLSAEAQRGLLGERSQLAYSLIPPFNDFVGKKIPEGSILPSGFQSHSEGYQLR